MRRPLRNSALTVLLACCGLGHPRALAADADPTQAENYRRDVAPFLEKYCTSCHGGEAPKAGLKLDAFPDAASALGEREAWENIQLFVEDQSMPPKGKPQPAPEEREAFVAWAQSALSTVDCTGPVNPGRVTMRRLNRSEYNNTIRDLVGVGFQPAADFPSDDVGYGFDNIGDVLTLPPLLMEKYLAAASAIMDEAIQTPEAAKTVGNRVASKESRALGTTGNAATVAIDFPFAGEYDVVVTAWGDQAGDEPAKMNFKLDGKPVGPEAIEVEAGRRAPREFSQRVKVGRGKHEFSATFLNDFYNEKEEDRRRRDRNLHVEQFAIVGPYDGEPAPPGEIHRRLFAPGEGAPDKAAGARAIIAEFAGRAFRRPAEPDEVGRYLALAERVRSDGNSPERSIQVALTAILVSPNFLFRVELDPQAPADSAKAGTAAATVPLNDWELASRLSYFLWSSLPDAELSDAARRGELKDPAELERQAKRMLQDSKADALVENFAAQWLTIRRLETINFDRRRFPGFNDRLRRDMLEETSRFFAHVMRDDSVGIMDLLDGQYTFINQRLAEHYGISGVEGDEFRRVELADGRRGGVITQGSVLAVTSNPTRTSPVKRGKYILEQILGTPPPPPPPDVPELDDGKRLKGTLRQRMEQHRSNPSCASCHARMDGLGFALENFDPVGAWREEERGNPIDASGELPDGTKFNGAAELRKVLRAQQGRFRETFAEKLLTYALGRGLERDDACVVDAIAAGSEAGGDRFARIVAEIVKSEPFRRKRGEAASAGGAPAE